MAWVKLSPEVHNGAKVADDVKAPARQGGPRPGGQDPQPEDRSRSWSRPASPRSRSRPSRWWAAAPAGAWSTPRPARCWSRRTRRSPRPCWPRSWAGGWPPSSCSRWCRARPTRSLYETLSRDHFKNPDEALVEIYRRLRPGDPPTVESARALFRGMFIDPRRYDLARVGRFMINKKLGIGANLNIKTLRSEDVVYVVRHLFQVKLGSKPTDDIDHLGNRRVRSVGELLENQFRVGLTRMERAVKERMSISDITNLMPHDLINAKPVSAVVKEFFGSSQLEPVHGPDEPAGRADPQAAPLRPGPARSLAGARRLRGARRASDPLRPHLPDRDAGRPEHRPDQLAQHLRAHQRVRLHRDPLPQGRARAACCRAIRCTSPRSRKSATSSPRPTRR